MAPDDDEDKRIKDVIGETSLADLQRWFGLPSLADLAEQAAAPPQKTEDPGVKAVREQREKAIAAVDPALLAAIGARAEVAWGLIQFQATIESKVDLEMAFFNQAMLDKLSTIAEPREVERPEDIEDELKDRTPQALLRDLHRVETFFEKTYEVVDAAAEQTLDIVAEVKSAMATNWKLPDLGDPSHVMIAKVVREVREERTLPWADLPKRANLPNRRVTE